MKVQARTNGNIVELPDETAHALISAGVYDVVEQPAEPQEQETPPPASRRKATR